MPTRSAKHSKHTKHTKHATVTVVYGKPAERKKRDKDDDNDKDDKMAGLPMTFHKTIAGTYSFNEGWVLECCLCHPGSVADNHARTTGFQT